jgi:hypothetical protein
VNQKCSIENSNGLLQSVCEGQDIYTSPPRLQRAKTYEVPLSQPLAGDQVLYSSGEDIPSTMSELQSNMMYNQYGLNPYKSEGLSDSEQLSLDSMSSVWNFFKLTWTSKRRSKSVDSVEMQMDLRRRRRVRFAPQVLVVLIPSLRDLAAADRELLWWTSDDMIATKQEAIEEITSYILKKASKGGDYSICDIKNLWNE